MTTADEQKSRIENCHVSLRNFEETLFAFDENFRPTLVAPPIYHALRTSQAVQPTRMHETELHRARQGQASSMAEENGLT
jgi:hypothetical protein